MIDILEKGKNLIFLFQDNAPIHTAQAVDTEAANSCFELLPHPSYSLDLELHLTSSYFLDSDSTSMIVILETMNRS